MESEKDGRGALRPRCQIADCGDPATDLVRNDQGTEIHLCPDCAKDFHSPPWEHIAGDTELKEGENAP